MTTVFYVLDKLALISNLGRRERKVHDGKIENISGALSKDANKHEQDVDE